ncbi:MAG TPA: hypothetical protein VFI31_12925, partial [Pirellulales bacterium]|nr:hypothetical protein [Pirellulales bacterium]
MSSSRPPSVDSSSASATIATIDADGLGRAARVQSVLALHQLTHFRTICWADEKDDLAARIADHRRLSAHWDTLKAAPTLRGGEAVAKGDRQS